MNKCKYRKIRENLELARKNGRITSRRDLIHFYKGTVLDGNVQERVHEFSQNHYNFLVKIVQPNGRTIDTILYRHTDDNLDRAVQHIDEFLRESYTVRDYFINIQFSEDLVADKYVQVTYTSVM